MKNVSKLTSDCRVIVHRIGPLALGLNSDRDAINLVFFDVVFEVGCSRELMLNRLAIYLKSIGIKFKYLIRTQMDLTIIRGIGEAAVHFTWTHFYLSSLRKS
jgi:hypothetical protein